MRRRAYVEITNICDLACSFCPGTRRERAFMSTERFRAICGRLEGHVSELFLHVMGEPLLHPELPELLAIAWDHGFRVSITTNGTHLGKRGQILLDSPAIRKVSVSLHSMEGNGRLAMGEYLENAWAFGTKAAEKGKICALRLWNLGGADSQNESILAFMETKLGTHPLDMPSPRPGSWRLRDRLYLDEAQKFDWPDMEAPPQDTHFCLGLRDQVAVLVDGTVVPCCLDHEGDIPLGHLPEEDLEDILESPRARAIYDGFTKGRPAEELCRRCGFATRFG